MSNNEQLFAEIIPCEEATLSGGSGYGYGQPHHYYNYKNDAYAGASADAQGYNTFSDTYTNAEVIQGKRSTSYSSSYASAY